MIYVNLIILPKYWY